MIAEVVIAGSVVGYITYRRRRGRKVVIEHVVAGSQAATQAAGVGDGIEFSPGQRITRDREMRHFATIGESGSGKSNLIDRYIVQAIDRGARVLLLDAQGDITARHQGSILAPWDSRSLRWDVASDVRTQAQAEALAAAVVPDPKGSENPMWSNAARAIFVAMFLRLIAEKRTRWGWPDVIEMSAMDLEALQQTVRQYHPTALPIVEGASVTLAGIRTQLASMLTPIRLLAQAWPSAGDDRQRLSLTRWILDPEHLPQHQRTIIVQMSGEHAKLTEFLLSSIIRLTLSLVASPRLDADDHDIWMFLDEFGQAGRITDLMRLSEIARKKGVRLMLTAQTIDALRSIYDRDADALLATVGTRIVCRTSGATAEWASKLFGTKRVREMRLGQSESSSSGGGQGGSSGESTSYSEHIEELPVIRVDEFQTLLGPNKQRGTITAAVHGFRQPAILTWPYLTLPRLRKPHAPAAWTLPPDDDDSDQNTAPPPSGAGETPAAAAGGGPGLVTDAPAPAPAPAPALPPWAAEQSAEQPQSTDKETNNADRDLSAVLSQEEDQ